MEDSWEVRMKQGPSEGAVSSHGGKGRLTVGPSTGSTQPMPSLVNGQGLPPAASPPSGDTAFLGRSISRLAWLLLSSPAAGCWSEFEDESPF